MTEVNVKRFIHCNNTGQPLVIVVDCVVRTKIIKRTIVTLESLKDDIDAGFIRETDPAYKMEMSSTHDDLEMKTTTRQRFVPTELGLEFLRFKML